MTTEQLVERLEKFIKSLKEFEFPVGPHTPATHSYVMGVQGRGQDIAHRLQALLDEHMKDKQIYVKPEPLSTTRCACGNFFRFEEEMERGICAVCVKKQCDVCPCEPSSSEECKACPLNQPFDYGSDSEEQEQWPF